MLVKFPIFSEVRLEHIVYLNYLNNHVIPKNQRVRLQHIVYININKYKIIKNRTPTKNTPKTTCNNKYNNI